MTRATATPPIAAMRAATLSAVFVGANQQARMAKKTTIIKIRRVLVG